MSGNRFNSNTSGDKGENMNQRDPSQIDSDEPCAKKAKVGADVKLDQSLQFKGTQIAIDKNGEQTMRTITLDNLPFALKRMVVGKTMRTFNLDSLPFEMKIRVVQKMSINSLCTFRRTSKENEDFVRRNRRHFQPQMNLKNYAACINQWGTDPVTFHLENSSFSPPPMKLTWEDRWELGNAQISSMKFHEVPAEVVHEVANLMNVREAITFASESLVDLQLPFIQQWQTDKSCSLTTSHFEFSLPPASAALVKWVENDGRFRKIWDREMHGRSVLRTVEINMLDPKLQCIFLIERNFEVAKWKLGRTGVLFVFDDSLVFSGRDGDENLVVERWLWTESDSEGEWL